MIGLKAVNLEEVLEVVVKDKSDGSGGWELNGLYWACVQGAVGMVGVCQATVMEFAWENSLYKVQQAFEGSQRQVMPVVWCFSPKGMWLEGNNAR